MVVLGWPPVYPFWEATPPWKVMRTKNTSTQCSGCLFYKEYDDQCDVAHLKIFILCGCVPVLAGGVHKEKRLFYSKHTRDLV